MITKCSSYNKFQQKCDSVFVDWIIENYEIEPMSNVLRTTYTSRTVTGKRYWNSYRPDFNVGDLVCSNGIGGVRVIYRVLKRVGTPKRPHYDLRLVYACCPTIFEGKKEYHINKIGTISYAAAGYFYLLMTPKKSIAEIDPFHCDVTHTDEKDWVEYVPKERKKKKRKIKSNV